MHLVRGVVKAADQEVRCRVEELVTVQGAGPQTDRVRGKLPRRDRMEMYVWPAQSDTESTSLAIVDVRLQLSFELRCRSCLKKEGS